MSPEFLFSNASMKSLLYKQVVSVVCEENGTASQTAPKPEGGPLARQTETWELPRPLPEDARAEPGRRARPGRPGAPAQPTVRCVQGEAAGVAQGRSRAAGRVLATAAVTSGLDGHGVPPLCPQGSGDCAPSPAPRASPGPSSQHSSGLLQSKVCKTVFLSLRWI